MRKNLLPQSDSKISNCIEPAQCSMKIYTRYQQAIIYRMDTVKYAFQNLIALIYCKLWEEVSTLKTCQIIVYLLCSDLLHSVVRDTFFVVRLMSLYEDNRIAVNPDMFIRSNGYLFISSAHMFHFNLRLHMDWISEQRFGT